MTWCLPLLAAAAPSDSSGWPDVLAVYGPFAPFAAALLGAVKVLWGRIKALEDKAISDQTALLEKIVPALIESTRVVTDVGTVLRLSVEKTAELSARPQLDPEFWRRVQNALERAERRRPLPAASNPNPEDQWV